MQNRKYRIELTYINSQITYYVWASLVDSWKRYPKLLVHNGSVIWMSGIT